MERRTTRISANQATVVAHTRNSGRASASSSRRPSMQGPVCGVCGDIGIRDELITCVVCKTAREHTYCAQAPPSQSRPNWHCETCIKGQGSSGIILRSLNRQLPYHYAPAWRGLLKVPQPDGNMSVDLAAYMPLQLSAKLYTVLQRLPAELETRPVACSVEWPEHFKAEAPSFEDVGVFLLPSDRRSSLKCTSLLRQLDARRHALKMKISSHVVLLLYSSQVLKEKCQRLGGNFFLWGLFRKRKMRGDPNRTGEIAPNRSDNETTSCMTPQQINSLPGVDQSDRTEMEHEDETSVSLQVGHDIPPDFAVSAVERKENNCSDEPTDSPKIAGGQEHERKVQQVAPPPEFRNETTSCTTPQKVNPPPRFDLSGGTEIRHEEETSVPLPVGPDIQPNFAVEGGENNCSNEPRNNPLSINQAPEVMEPVTALAQLSERTEFARIVARVIRLWSHRSNPSSGVAFKYRFVLVDCEGTAIEGLIRVRHYRLVWHYFVEGAICELERFKVTGCPTSYHTVSHKFSLNVTAKTTIKLVPNPSVEIPFYHFNFVSFENIGTEIKDGTEVVDIIGRLVKIDPVRTIQEVDRLVHIQAIHLVNERDFPLEITIWDHCPNASPVATLAKLLKEGPVVLALNSLQLNLHRGKIKLKTDNPTRFYFDPKLPVIADFFRASNLQGRNYPTVVDVAQPQTMHNVGSSSEMKNSHPLRVTIAEMLGYDSRSSTDKQFQCIAEIVAVNNPCSWYYNSCFNCQKQLVKDDASQWYRCLNCCEWRDRPVTCYYLAFQVADSTASTEFWFIGNNAELIVAAPADCVRNETNLDLHLAPRSIISAIGKKMLFTVKFNLLTLQQRHASFKVLRLEQVPPDESILPSHTTLLLPVGAATLPLSRGDIAESSEQKPDKGKRKLEETFPIQRQLEEEHESNHPHAPPRKKAIYIPRV